MVESQEQGGEEKAHHEKVRDGDGENDVECVLIDLARRSRGTW